MNRRPRNGILGDFSRSASSSPRSSSRLNGSSSSGDIRANRRSPHPDNHIQSQPGNLRPVIIDGSNLAMQLGKKVFAARGILICARHFLSRGHRVLAFVPYFRRHQRQDNFRRPMKDQHLLEWMYEHNLLNFTPSRTVTLENDQRRRIVCYDDYYIVHCAHTTGGVIVSNDQYRDVMKDHPEWVETVQNRLVMFSWVGEMFMVAEDPFGRHGPRINEVLRYDDDDRVSSFSVEWTKEHIERLVGEIDEILVAPPPSLTEYGENSNNEIQVRDVTSLTDLLEPSMVPRFGFARKENTSFNHRSRRWMMQDEDALRVHQAMANGFGDNFGFTNGVGSDGDDWTQEVQSAFGGGTDFMASATVDEKLAAFQDFTGIKHLDTCKDFLGRFKWNVHEAIDAALVASEGFESINSADVITGDDDEDLLNSDGANDQAVACASINGNDYWPEPNYADFSLWFSDDHLTTIDNNAHTSHYDENLAATSTLLHDDGIIPSTTVSVPSAQILNMNSGKLENGTNVELLEYFCGIFPRDVVQSVMNKYKNIRKIDVLSNLLADALISK